MAKYCVLGGHGFIGANVVRMLREQCHEVLVVGSRKRNEPHYYEWRSLSYTSFKEILTGVDGVINLAYSSTPKTSFDNPIGDIKDNLPFIVSFFEWMSLFPVKRIVMVSTGGAIYGNTNECPTTELAETNPISPYGITKLAMEKYAFMYHAHKQLPIICVRPGNAYGEGQRPFVGQGFIATAVHSIFERKPIRVFGREGTVRDFIHVADVASGIIAALQFGKVGEVYNIGTGVGASTKDILDFLSGLAQAAAFDTPEISFSDLRPFDVAQNILDSSKLKAHTHWVPKTELFDGIRRYWEGCLQQLTGSTLDRFSWAATDSDVGLL